MCTGSWFQTLGPAAANAWVRGAKVRDRGADYKVATSGGSESLSAADVLDVVVLLGADDLAAVFITDCSRSS